MKATVVRYQAKPERADENQKLVEAVFADLNARQPEGFTVVDGRIAAIDVLGDPERVDGLDPAFLDSSN